MPARAPATALLLVGALLLAGCASNGGPKIPDAEAPAPRSIAGVVVDEAVRPIEGALVEVLDLQLSATTDADGAFLLTDVPAGVHILRASHGLYDAQQQTVEVVADDDEGARAKFQLTRVIFATPYSQLQKFDAFIVCSVGFSLYASEECGEGVGMPCEDPVPGTPLPPPFCSRVGGQGNNFAQWDFYLAGPFVRTLVVEMSWAPASPTLQEFQLNVGNDWTCTPFCNGNGLNVTGGPSPLYATVTFDGLQLTDRLGNDVELSSETRFSTFVWPNWGSGDPEQLNVAVNQPYQAFATAFYYLPAPEGWSFLAGDVAPF